ncbi:unnamed protein product, partial [Ixodes hexagonus]
VGTNRVRVRVPQTMLDATLSDRESSFQLAPGTFMFLHWLVGMVYVFYFASFVLLLREVLRPGLLWFLRNLNDPDFNPIQEMIHLPILQHVRRFLVSLVIFGTTVLLMVWVPVRVIQALLPGFLPYHVITSSDSPTQEISLELILLQVVLPTLLEQGHMKQWLKALVRGWCLCISYLLDLRSYLLGDVPLTPEDASPDSSSAQVGNASPVSRLASGIARSTLPASANCGNSCTISDGSATATDLSRESVPTGDTEAEGSVEMDPPQHGLELVEEEEEEDDEEEEEEGEGEGLQPGVLAAAHQALLQGVGPSGFQAYCRPRWFPVRVAFLLLFICLSLTAMSFFLLTVPVSMGRLVMLLLMPGGRVHEFYTAACGLYSCWLALRCLTLLCSWLPRGWNTIVTKLHSWMLI